MDSDRKSTVSSFYGGRKGSMDALNNDFPNNQRARADSQSSFFNASAGAAMTGGHDNRHSIAPYGPSNATGRPSAGYNRNSYFNTGREEPLRAARDEEDVFSSHDVGNDDAWDVYADFNNAGPKYSSGFAASGDAQYQQLPPGARSPMSGKFGDETTSLSVGGNQVEMVTVPAMGAEWSKDEMKAMTKSGRKEMKANNRRGTFKRWMRDEEGLCGIHWMTRKTIAFTLFGACVIAAVALGICIPRVPGFAFNGESPLSAANGTFNSSIPTEFSRSPANFSFPAYISMQMDTTSSYVSLHFNNIQATVYDQDSFLQVATGSLSMTAPARTYILVNMPLNFSYSAVNDSDPTWNDFYDACRNGELNVNGTRPPLKLTLDLTMDIRGLIGTHTTSTQISTANCPITLPENSV